MIPKNHRVPYPRGSFIAAGWGIREANRTPLPAPTTRVPHSSQHHRDEWECKPSTNQLSSLPLRFVRILATALFLTALTIPAHAQGCTQCRDNTAATPPTTQRAYRNAILILVVPASGLFLATLALFKSQR